MKNKKKAFFSIGAVVLVAAFIFYACTKDAKKPLAATATNAATQPESTPNNALARGTGTATYYSKDDSTGRFYKMDVSWSNDGVISVDRSVVTSGYPTSTATEHIIEDGITTTKIDLDTDTTTYDTLKVTFDATKRYYVIGFHPSSGGNYFGFINGGTMSMSCRCLEGPTGQCLLSVKRCTGCTQCMNDMRPVFTPGEGNDGGYLRSIAHSGCIIVEASGINIIN